MPPVRQASFNGGEIAPGLYGRTNLKRYAESLRLCRNALPLQEGPVTNRAGLSFKAEMALPTSGIRLIPFVFSSGSLSRNFVLAFTHMFVQIWKDGVLKATLDTPYVDTDLPYLKYVQSGQVMAIACRQKKKRELTWISDSNWQLAEFAITKTITPPVVNPVDPNDITSSSNTVALKEWSWVVTAVKRHTHEESVASAYITEVCALSTNTPARITWSPVLDSDGNPPEYYNVYRGRNGKFGFVGSATGTSFWDDGQGPVFAEAPPQNRDPFPTLDDEPQVVTYHDQRLVNANMWNNPGGIEMSRMGDGHNYDRASPPKAEDAVTFNFMSRQYEEIRNLVSMKNTLVVMTNGTEWAVSGSEGVIMQDDITMSPQSRWGSSWLDPLVIGDAILFTQDVGSTIRELVATEGGLDGNDLTLIAQHLFQGHKIVSWCYAHEPFRTIWAVREDGKLLSCTYVRQQEIFAFGIHDTHDHGNGNFDMFDAVCSVPGTNENEVWFAVRRYVNGGWHRYLEKLAPRVGATASSGVFLDSAVTGTGSVINGVAHLGDQQVYALCDGVVRGPFYQAGGSVNVGQAATVVHVGILVTTDIGSLDMYSTEDEIRPLRKNVKKVFCEVQDTAPFRAGQHLTDNLMLARRPDGQPWEGLYTGLAEVLINSDWDDKGAVFIRHSNPTPFTMLSLIREVEFGGY